MSQRSICVFCGSHAGSDPEFKRAAASVGRALASANRKLVYGGGNSGLMGVVSQSAREAGGTTVGVIPKAIADGGGEGSDHARIEIDSETIVVGSMHERKTKMASLADGGFIGLPGGFGTFEEVLEATTWTQLGVHTKPVVLLNINGFYTPLKQLVQNAVNTGFIKPGFLSLITFVEGADKGSAEYDTFDWGAAAIQAIENWTMPSERALFSNWGDKGDLSQT